MNVLVKELISCDIVSQMRLFYFCLKAGNFYSVLFFFLIFFYIPLLELGSKDEVSVGTYKQDKCSPHICGEKMVTSLQRS